LNTSDKKNAYGKQNQKIIITDHRKMQVTDTDQKSTISWTWCYARHSCKKNQQFAQRV